MLQFLLTQIGKLKAAVSSLNSKTSTVVLQPGTNNIGNFIVAGYNTGSGNYFDTFISIDTSHINTISSVSVESGSSVISADERYTIPSDAAAVLIEKQPCGILVEFAYSSTKPVNKPVSVFLNNVKVICT